MESDVLVVVSVVGSLGRLRPIVEKAFLVEFESSHRVLFEGTGYSSEVGRERLDATPVILRLGSVSPASFVRRSLLHFGHVILGTGFLHRLQLLEDSPAHSLRLDLRGLEQSIQMLFQLAVQRVIGHFTGSFERNLRVKLFVVVVGTLVFVEMAESGVLGLPELPALVLEHTPVLLAETLQLQLHLE